MLLECQDPVAATTPAGLPGWGPRSAPGSVLAESRHPYSADCCQHVALHLPAQPEGTARFRVGWASWSSGAVQSEHTACRDPALGCCCFSASASLRAKRWADRPARKVSVPGQRLHTFPDFDRGGVHFEKGGGRKKGRQNRRLSLVRHSSQFTFNARSAIGAERRK